MQELPFLEARVRVLRDHDVVQDIDAEDTSRLDQTSGNGQVLLAGGRIAGRMIMREDQARRRDRNRGLIDLVRMNDARVQASDRDDLAAEHMVPRVEV